MTDTKVEMDTPDLSNWGKLAYIIQAVFREVCMVKKATWKAVVLIFKGGGNSHGIGIMEVVTVIINRHPITAISLHDVLHEFRAGRGTGIASLEEKFLQ